MFEESFASVTLENMLHSVFLSLVFSFVVVVLEIGSHSICQAGLKTPGAK